ncbi:MAG: hypothetical protein J6T03_03115 [Bacteroidales bacterium]|nr:hypothetical protein [Bacteroidales bacterium]
MEDLEITSLLTADPASAPKLNTLGYDSDGNAAQVRLCCIEKSKNNTVKELSRFFFVPLHFE